MFGKTEAKGLLRAHLLLTVALPVMSAPALMSKAGFHD
jgi:hypothetical protein